MTFKSVLRAYLEILPNIPATIGDTKNVPVATTTVNALSFRRDVIFFFKSVLRAYLEILPNIPATIGDTKNVPVATTTVNALSFRRDVIFFFILFRTIFAT